MVAPAVVAETAVHSCTLALSHPPVHTSPGRAATWTRCCTRPQRGRSRESTRSRSFGCLLRGCSLCCRGRTSSSYRTVGQQGSHSHNRREENPPRPTPTSRRSRRPRARWNNPSRARQAPESLRRGRMGSRCMGASLSPSRCCTCSRPPPPTGTGREQAAELGAAARVASVAAAAGARSRRSRRRTD